MENLDEFKDGDTVKVISHCEVYDGVKIGAIGKIKGKIYKDYKGYYAWIEWKSYTPGYIYLFQLKIKK